MSQPPLVLLALLGTVAGCSSPNGDPPPPDASPPQEAGPQPDATEAIPAPLPPTPPHFEDWLCPPSWTPERVAADTAAEHRICRPPAPVSCPAGEAVFLGEANCQPIGSSCPAGEDFPAEADLLQLAADYGGAMLYVKAGATNGQGSRTQPWGTIGAALQSAADGDIVVLAPGTYSEALSLNKRIALIGSCPKETIIAGASTSSDKPVIELKQAALIADLRLAAKQGGILISGGASARLRRLEITNSVGYALMTMPGKVALDLDTVVLRDVQGAGLACGPGAAVRGQQVVIEGTASYGLLVGGSDSPSPGAPQIQLVDLIIREIGEAAAANSGAGVRIEGQAQVALERCLVDHATNIAVVVTQGGALDLVDCHLRETRPGSLEQGRAMVVFDGSRATLRRVLVEKNYLTALQAWGSSTSGPPPQIALEQVVIRDTAANVATGETGCGLVVAGEVRGSQVLLADNTDAAVLVATEHPVAALELELTDAAVIDTRARPKDNYRGAGLVIDSGHLTLERVLIAGNRSHGLIAGSSGISEEAPRLEIKDLIVRDTLPDQALQQYGRALEIQGAEISIERASLEHNQDIALLLAMATDTQQEQEPSTADLTDLTINDTASHKQLPFSGMGLVVQQGSRATVQRLQVTGCQGAGVLVIQPEDGPAGTLQLAAAVIHGTERSACALLPAQDPDSCIQNGVIGGGGSGVSLIGNVGVTLSDFDIFDNALCGIQLSPGASLSLSAGELHHNAIGLNASEGIDLTELLGPTVHLYDNDTNIDSADLPIPSVAETLEHLGF